MRRFMFVGLIAAALLAVPVAAYAGGPPGPAFYVDGELYRTVGTPTDFSNTGAPLSTFDIIYEFDGVQTNVAEAAPGDPGYNGGRWMVLLIGGEDYQEAVDLYADGDHFDSAEQIEAALNDNSLDFTATLVKQFECPVIPVPGGHN